MAIGATGAVAPHVRDDVAAHHGDHVAVVHRGVDNVLKDFVTRSPVAGARGLAPAEATSVHVSDGRSIDVCEAGERCEDASCSNAGACRNDCPYVAQTCPSGPWPGAGECSGNGRCIAASGACDCYESQGYVGTACHECKSGYLFDDATKTCAEDSETPF